MDGQSLFPIPVVRLIVPDEHDRILLVKRDHSRHASGKWCLPGGKIDYEDTVEEAVRRELYEETNLTVNELKFLFYQDSLPLEAGGMHCINLYFECRCSGEIALNEESSQFIFLRPEDVSSYRLAFRNDEGLLRYWGRRLDKSSETR